MAMNFEDMVACNKCGKEFHANEIIYDEALDKEFCPYCGEICDFDYVWED